MGDIWIFLFLLLNLSVQGWVTPTFANDLESPVYGANHLHPSPDSLLGHYINETGAFSFPRAFAINEVMGPDRLVVLVSQDSFQILFKYFSDQSFLYLFHEPLTHLTQTAYKGKRGVMARMSDEFLYTQSGVDLIPICLTPGEIQRAELYFKLAESTQRKFDIANFPWLLLDENGNPYTSPGDMNSLSEWFTRMPIGEEFDQSRIHNPYVLNNLSNAVSWLVTQVWSNPYSHKSLRQLLDLTPYDPSRGFNTPALIAISLLASASVERVPVLFRFVSDHTLPIDEDFDLWLDLDWDPKQILLQPF